MTPHCSNCKRHNVIIFMKDGVATDNWCKDCGYRMKLRTDVRPLPPPKHKERTIKVCAGIGDNIWLIQKLLKTGEKFRFEVAGEKPHRGKQIFEITPDIVADVSYSDEFSSLNSINDGVQKIAQKWSDVTQHEFFLSANEHLEAGLRLETFMPDLPTMFRVPWETKQYEIDAARILPVRSNEHRRYIGLYGSTYSVVRNWGFWEAPEWLELATKVNKLSEVTFIIMGAKFDMDLATELSARLERWGIRHIKLIGWPLGLVVEVMRRLTYFFSFPSGLGILSTSVGCPTLMFYPPHLEAMIPAWAEPAAIESGFYRGTLFCSPREALAQALGHGHLKERLSRGLSVVVTKDAE